MRIYEIDLNKFDFTKINLIKFQEHYWFPTQMIQDGVFTIQLWA